MSEKVLPMVGFLETVVGSDALPRRRCYCSGRHTSSMLTCARLRPEVTGRKQGASLFTQLETTEVS
jgi:hypothetical protein